MFAFQSSALYLTRTPEKTQRGGFAEAVTGVRATQLLPGVKEVLELGLDANFGGSQVTVVLQAQFNLTLWKMWSFLDHPDPDQVLG